jgi:hypothetical protein
MPNEKQCVVLNKLYNYTKNNKVSWSESVNSGCFIVTRNDVSVEIYDNKLIGLSGNVCFKVYDENLDVVDEFYFSCLDDVYKIAKELYEMARRSAKGTDKVLDRLLSSFQDEDLDF